MSSTRSGTSSAKSGTEDTGTKSGASSRDTSASGTGTGTGTGTATGSTRDASGTGSSKDTTATGTATGSTRDASSKDGTGTGASSRAGTKSAVSGTAKSATAADDDGGGYSKAFGNLDTQYYDSQVAQSAAKSQRGGGAVSKAEQEKAASAMIEASKRAAPTQYSIKATGPSTGRRVYFMRHAERMDRIFPGYLKLAYTDTGRWRPYDLNMPLRAISRKGGANDFYNDTMITEMGHVSSQMIGRAMNTNKIYFNAIYCSPALRCIDTTRGLLRTLTISTKVGSARAMSENTSV